MRKISLALIAVIAAAATPAVAGDENWVADFDKAVEMAKKDNKNLLVDFTGSDWCGWCIKLHDEVFQHEEFLSAVKDKFVLVALDFPKGEEAKAKVPNPERNQELSQKYGVRGFPTVLLMTPDGEVFGRTGYRKGGPEKYVEHIAALRTDYDATMAFMKKWEAADDAAKQGLWEEACTIVEKTESDLSKTKLKPVVAYAFEIDAENEKGLKLRALKTMFAAGIADPAMADDAKKLDAKNENGLYEKVVAMSLRSVRSVEGVNNVLAEIDALSKLGFQDDETAFALLGNAAYMSKKALNDAARASGYAKRALEIGSDNERFVKILKSLVIEEEEAEEEEAESEESEIDEAEPKKQP